MLYYTMEKKATSATATPPMVVKKKGTTQPKKISSVVNPETGAKTYLDAKAKKRKKRVIYWCIFTFVVVFFFSSTPIIAAIFGANSWIASLMPYNVLGPSEMVFDPNFGDYGGYVAVIPNWYISILRAVYITFIVWMALKLVWVIAQLLSVKASNRHKTIISMITSFAKYTGIVVWFFVMLGIAGVPLAGLLAGAGVIAIVIGFGAQQVLADILSGLFIVFENSFEVGDIIKFQYDEELRGEVLNIGIRTTKIKAKNGDVHVINNSELRVLTNQTNFRSVCIIDVTIEYGENLERVEKIIKDNLQIIAVKLTAITEGPEYRGTQEFTPSGVVLRLFAKCDEPNRMQLTRDLKREMKLLFDKHKIKFAVPNVKVSKGD